ASDPENGPLTYTVVWGDEPIQIQPYLVNQTATFSHTYSRAGTYTPTVTVTDDHGLSAKTSATLTVTPQGPTTGKEPVNVNLNTETMSSTAAVGQKDVCFLEFNLFAGATTETRVTDISTNGYIDENGDGGFQQGTDNNVNLKDIVQAVKLIDSSSKQVITTESVPSFGTVVFDNVNILISKGTHRAFKICGDISVNAYLNNTPEKVAFTIPLLSITAQNSDGNTLSQTGTANTNYSTVITVVASSSASGGALTLSVSPSTPQEGILFPGDVKKLVSKYKFSAAGEGFVVRKLAVNNFQSGVTDADLAEYDNNVKSVTISYLNSQGQTEEKTSYVSQGNALFSGLNIAVPKDGTADLSVFVNVNTVLLGATPGEFLRLDLAFNQFEAMGTTSGEIFRAYRMDADFLSSADFDFGEMRWMNSGVSVQGTDTTGSNTLGETTSFNVQPGVLLPIGTLICVDDNSSGTCDAEDIYVVESWVNEGDTVTTTLLDDAGDGVYANNAGDNILYALPGDGYLITTNQMQIGASTPTLALDPNSPRGPRTPLSGDTTFIFDVRAANSGDIHITPGTELIASDGYDGNGNNNLPLGSSVETGKRLDGLSMTEPLMNFTSGDTISFEPTQQSTSQYKRIAFWMMWSDAAGTLQPTFTDLKLETASSSTGQPTNGTSLSQLICGADQSNLVSGEWYFCDLDLPGNDRYVHLELDDMTEFSTADTLYFDVMRLYNEKIVVDIASDGDLDTYAHNISNPGSPVSALLALSGTNFSADGYISTKTNGASATTEASVTFIPTNLNPLLNFASGTTTVLAVQTDTASLLHEDAGEADMLTFSIAYGRSVDGNVVAGGFWYNDGYNTIKWLGNTEGSRLIGNTLEY
ncbi:PKD domain-containing protein, partial [Candidatus Peregrinibacteria bacterium]|nr:PKD domain-containing protein [Candidatus Peregrinibacteria bacterium]